MTVYIKAENKEDGLVLLWKQGFRIPALFMSHNFYKPIILNITKIYREGAYPNIEKIRNFLEELDYYAISNVRENSNILLSLSFKGKKMLIIPQQLDYLILKEISKDLFDYQKIVLERALKMKRAPIILDTGLGKTIIALKILEYLKKKYDYNKFLVIVPRKGLVKVWKEEMEKWNISLPLEIRTIQKLIKDYDVKGKSYKQLEKEIKDKWDCIIIDEAHEILSYSGRPKASYKLVKVLSSKTEYLYLLTATPVVNTPSELYGYLSVLQWKVSQLRSLLDNTKRKNLYKKLFRDIMIRYNIDKGFSVEKKIIDIPFYSKSFDKIFLWMADNFYDIIKFWDILGKEVAKRKLFSIFSKYISKSAVFWNGFSITKHLLIESHPKIKKLKDILAEHSNEKILVIGYHRNMELLSNLIKDRPVFIFNGKRKDDLTKFKKTENGVLLLSIRAGGLGINLENVDTVIFYEYWWTWVSYKQALDRVMRITSKNKNKTVYNLVIDPKISFKNIESLAGASYYNFIKALYEKGYASLDKWMINRVVEKREELEKLLLEGREGIVNVLIEDVLTAYKGSINQK